MGVTGKNRINIFKNGADIIIGGVDKLLEDVIYCLPDEKKESVQKKENTISSGVQIQIFKHKNYFSTESLPVYIDYPKFGTSAHSRISLLKTFIAFVNLINGQEETQTLEINEGNYAYFTKCIDQNPHFTYDRQSNRFEVLQKLRGFITVGILDILSDYHIVRGGPVNRLENRPSEAPKKAPDMASDKKSPMKRIVAPEVQIDREVQDRLFTILLDGDKQRPDHPNDFVEEILSQVGSFDEATVLRMVNYYDVKPRVEKRYLRSKIDGSTIPDLITTKSRVNQFFNLCVQRYPGNGLWEKCRNEVINLLDCFSSVYALVPGLIKTDPDWRKIKILVAKRSTLNKNGVHIISSCRDKAVLFKRGDPLSEKIQVGNVITGIILREEPRFVIVSPKKVISPDECSILLKLGAEAFQPEEILGYASKGRHPG